MPFSRQLPSQLLGKHNFQLKEKFWGIFKYLPRDGLLVRLTRIPLASQFCASVPESLELVYFTYLLSSTGKHSI